MEKDLSEDINQHIGVFSSSKPGNLSSLCFLLQCCHSVAIVTNKVPHGHWLCLRPQWDGEENQKKKKPISLIKNSLIIETKYN